MITAPAATPSQQTKLVRRRRYAGAGIAGDRGGVRKPARIAVAQSNKAAISGVLTEECMQKHVGAMPKADDRVTDAHQRIPNGMPDVGFYFSPVLAMPWIR